MKKLREIMRPDFLFSVKLDTRVIDAARLMAEKNIGIVAVLDGPVGAASAIKMAYGGWNKGQQALLLAIRALAAHEGVDAALLAEWSRSMPDVPARSERAVEANIKKAWRFVGEMEENAAAFEAAGLPAGFHEAAGEIYRRLAGWKDTATPPSMADVAKTLAP